MAPEHQDEPDPTTPPVPPEGFVERAPRTNGGQTAPPKSFGVAGDPDAARDEAARSADPRGAEAPESDRRNEPAD